MNSVILASSADAVAGLLDLVHARDPVVDVTYGNGLFWKDQQRQVFGCDIDPLRAPHLIADFRALPFADSNIPTVIFDPPFHPKVNSAEEVRFKAVGRNEKEMRATFVAGVSECWRVCQSHLLVKCQGFVHNHQPQWMPLWAIDVCGEPFEWLIVWRNGKRASGRWKSFNSLRRNHADYLLFSKQGNKR